MNYGSPETSTRLRATLEALLNAGANGLTRLELRETTGGEAVNSDIAALRQYAIDNNADFYIPRAEYITTTTTGAKLYRYFAFKK